MAGDAPAEDEGEFVGLADGAIGVEEPLLEGIDGGATTKDKIVAELHLRKKQPVLNAGVLSLLGSEKGRETGQPFLGTGEQIVSGEGIGEFLQGLPRKSLRLCLAGLRIRWFDPIAEASELPDHSCRALVFRLFGDG